MSHVDQGLLHAWLDGALRAEEPETADRLEAHLAGCADCRARLEEAERLRANASEIFDAAEPDTIDAPPFEEIAARVGRTRGPGQGDGLAGGERPRAPGFRRALPLTWAASVALAVAAGWWAHGLAGPERTVFDGGDAAGPAEQAVAAGAAEGGTEQDGSLMERSERAAAPEGSASARSAGPDRLAQAERTARAEGGGDVAPREGVPGQIPTDLRAADDSGRARALDPAPIAVGMPAVLPEDSLADVQHAVLSAAFRLVDASSSEVFCVSAETSADAERARPETAEPTDARRARSARSEVGTEPSPELLARFRDHRPPVIGASSCSRTAGDPNRSAIAEGLVQSFHLGAVDWLASGRAAVRVWHDAADGQATVLECAALRSDAPRGWTATCSGP